MDIYNYAKSIDYAADYMPMDGSGYVYKIQEYGKQLKAGNTNAKIAVYQDGIFIGYAKKM